MREKITVMILPVGLSCLLDCSYCYHGGKESFGCKSRIQIIPDYILKKVVYDSVQLAKNIDFLSHGGEPLLAGLPYFKKLVGFQERIDFNGIIRNIIQTNAVLLDKNKVQFFSKMGFILSTSVDGSKRLHDANRHFSNGGGSYNLVKLGVKLWRSVEEGKNLIGAVTLITSTNVDYPEEVFNGLKKCGVTSCALHFCSQNESGSITNIPEDFKTLDFLKKFFDLWFEKDDPKFPIRNFRNILRVLCGGTTLDCASTVGGCSGFIAVDQGGDVYPCHRFVGNPDFKIGNILEKSLREIYEDGADLYARISKLHESCSSCEFLNMCGGGCSYEKYVVCGDFGGVPPECKIKKELFLYIRDKVSF